VGHRGQRFLGGFGNSRLIGSSQFAKLRDDRGRNVAASAPGGEALVGIGTLNLG
jgi:hypothetical protein